MLYNSKLIINIIFHTTVYRPFPCTQTDGKARHCEMFKNTEMNEFQQGTCKI